MWNGKEVTEHVNALEQRKREEIHSHGNFKASVWVQHVAQHKSRKQGNIILLRLVVSQEQSMLGGYGPAHAGWSKLHPRTHKGCTWDIFTNMVKEILSVGERT